MHVTGIRQAETSLAMTKLGYVRFLNYVSIYCTSLYPEELHHHLLPVTLQ